MKIRNCLATNFVIGWALISLQANAQTADSAASNSSASGSTSAAATPPPAPAPGVLGTTAPSGTAPTSGAAPTATPFSSTYGYSVMLPAGWKTQPSGFRNTDLFAYYPVPSSSGFVASFNVIVHGVPKEATVTDIANSYNTAVSKQATGFKAISQKTIKIAGSDAYQVEYSSDQGDPVRKIYTEEYLITRNGYLYEFSYASLLGDQTDHASEFSDFVHSIKWIKPTAPAPSNPGEVQNAKQPQGSPSGPQQATAPSSASQPNSPDQGDMSTAPIPPAGISGPSGP